MPRRVLQGEARALDVDPAVELNFDRDLGPGDGRAAHRNRADGEGVRGGRERGGEQERREESRRDMAERRHPRLLADALPLRTCNLWGQNAASEWSAAIGG